MTINPEIILVLREFKIDKSAGLLCLLGIHFDLDVETVCPEEVVKQINLTKIVNKDYQSGAIEWNMPLFAGHETAFDWITNWVDMFSAINPDRRGSPRDAVSRMKDFFRKYPEYRREDVYKATQLYLSTVRDPRFLMKSHKFIFDGAGAMKKSTLLEFCEKSKIATAPDNIKGTLMT